MSRNPNGINFFGPQLIPGDPLAKQIGMVDKINTLCQVLSSLDGINGISIVRNGKQWEIVFNPGTVEAGEGGLTWEEIVTLLLAVEVDMLSPSHVLGKKTVSGVTTIGWVATVTHASQHPIS